ncbi:hypothetical protein LTR36_009895 [Oleoguttula mirabilis]|uniref:Uncharacterized protein n=1 Tax=Oleoguttula mirabilis TaxID=1507867 RepID=A0AAV9J4V0_9PEZI|nr:hypothetical protein LTR36_009895 [Oleoguttula mirabilis]
MFCITALRVAAYLAVLLNTPREPQPLAPHAPIETFEIFLKLLFSFFFVAEMTQGVYAGLHHLASHGHITLHRGPDLDGPWLDAEGGGLDAAWRAMCLYPMILVFSSCLSRTSIHHRVAPDLLLMVVFECILVVEAAIGLPRHTISPL